MADQIFSLCTENEGVNLVISFLLTCSQSSPKDYGECNMLNECIFLQL
jgi:hypothetical protein